MINQHHSIVALPKQRRLSTLLTAVLLAGVSAQTFAAGNVEVDVRNSNITIDGDNADNALNIVGYDTGVTIFGVDGTTVNGQQLVYIDIVELPERGNLKFNMRDGNDSIIADFGDVGFDVGTVNLGEGDNSFALATTSFFDLTVTAKRGSDAIMLTDIAIADDLKCRLSKGDDGLILSNVDVAGDLTADGGADVDDFTAAELTVGGRETIQNFETAGE